MRKTFLYLVAVAAAATLGLLASVALAGGGGSPPEMVTICHAAGQEGTTKFVTLTIPYNAVYGQAGHLNENGTPQAGHEEDYLGPCQGDPDPCESSAAAQYGECEPTTTTPTTTTPTTTTPTTPTETTPTTPEPRCPPGMTPTAGKDGQPGNDECEFPKTPTTPTSTTTTPTTPPQSVPTTTTTTPTTTTPTTTTPPASTPPKTSGESSSKPPAAKPPKLTGDQVKDKCKPKNGLLVCKAGGKTITVVPGQG